MKGMIQSTIMGAAVCFLATELAGLVVASVPAHCNLPSSNFMRTLLVGVLVTVLPALLFAYVMAGITGWLSRRCKPAVFGYLASLVLASLAFLACVPHLLYFHVPLIPDYSLMTGKHYFLWATALASGVVGTWATNMYWRRILAQPGVRE